MIRREMLLECEPTERLHDPELYHEYFQRIFSYVDLDQKNIQELRHVLDYPEVADRYQFMPETVPVLVTYDGLDESMVEKWRVSLPIARNVAGIAAVSCQSYQAPG